MPELPEVETVLRGLEPITKGANICDAKITRPNLRYPFPQNFMNRLKNAEITHLKRRAKHIILELNSGESLIIHLGMSGRIKILCQQEPLNKHDHVILKLSNGKELRYHDPRRFGFMDLVPTSEINNYKAFKNLGPEPFSSQFNAEYLLKASSQRKTNIKNFLLDQNIIAGLGNIYVCEVLFLTKTHPAMPSAHITKPLASTLVSTIQTVLNEAIRVGGSTLKDHAQPNGEMGYFQHQFKVYGKEGKSCATCSEKIARISQSGRSTFFCPNCQAL